MSAAAASDLRRLDLLAPGEHDEVDAGGGGEDADAMDGICVCVCVSEATTTTTTTYGVWIQFENISSLLSSYNLY